MAQTQEAVTKARQKINEARRITVLTGAGISAESGVPTFRGPGGMWRNMRAEELATPEAFERDPGLVWEFYDWRRTVLKDILPNAAHLALKDIEARGGDFTLITQNVDGLHHLAGSRNVLELHGNIWRLRCTGCGEITENRDVPIKIPPYCECASLLRPDIIWFGEGLPEAVFEEAVSKSATAEVMLILGTSSLVQPAASLALVAKSGEAFVIEVNTEETPISSGVDLSIRGKAAEIVPLISRP